MDIIWLAFDFGVTLKEETFAEEISRGNKITKFWEFTFANDPFDYFSREQTFANEALPMLFYYLNLTK